MNPRILWLAIGVFLLIAIVYLWIKGIKGTAKAVATGVVNATTGIVVGTTEALGLPQVDHVKCYEALINGDTLGSMAHCTTEQAWTYFWNDHELTPELQAVADAKAANLPLVGGSNG